MFNIFTSMYTKKDVEKLINNKDLIVKNVTKYKYRWKQPLFAAAMVVNYPESSVQIKS